MSGGWHPDPLGRYPQRYFDGTQWTAHVVGPAGATTVDPLGVQPGPASMPAAPPVTAGPRGGAPFTKGGPWWRFLARLLDGVIVGIPLLIVTDALFGTETINVDTENGFDFAVNLDGGEMILITLLYGLYEVGMIGAFGRTLGKWMCGVHVVRQGSLELPGPVVSVVRYLCYCLYIIPILGWVLWVVSAVRGFSDPHGETIHDKLAKTLVASSPSQKP